MHSEKLLDKITTKTLKIPKRQITMRTNLSNGAKNDDTEAKMLETKWPNRGGLWIFFGTNV